MHLIPAGIIGTGHYTPQKILNNKDLATLLNVSEEWIFNRTGIKERRISDESITTSQVGAKAALEAIEKANILPEEIDMIICSTITPDKLCPATACNIQAIIGATKAACFDINSSCSGFIFGLATAYQYIATGMLKTILVIGVDLLSKYTNYNDSSTCVLFGDGAGAAIIKATDENSFLSFDLGSEGNLENMIHIPSTGTVKSDLPPYLTLKGKDVFKWALGTVPDLIRNTLNKANLKIEDIDYFLFHQANQRITDAISNKLKQPKDKFLSNIANYGNTSAASIPILLSESVKSGKLKRGNKIMLVGFGAGLSWGLSIIDWKL